MPFNITSAVVIPDSDYNWHKRSKVFMSFIWTHHNIEIISFSCSAEMLIMEALTLCSCIYHQYFCQLISCFSTSVFRWKTLQLLWNITWYFIVAVTNGKGKSFWKKSRESLILLQKSFFILLNINWWQIEISKVILSKENGS